MSNKITVDWIRNYVRLHASGAASASKHNELPDLQGGDSRTEFYHLTKKVHDDLNAKQTEIMYVGVKDMALSWRITREGAGLAFARFENGAYKNIYVIENSSTTDNYYINAPEGRLAYVTNDKKNHTLIKSSTDLTGVQVGNTEGRISLMNDGILKSYSPNGSKVTSEPNNISEVDGLAGAKELSTYNEELIISDNLIMYGVDTYYIEEVLEDTRVRIFVTDKITGNILGQSCSESTFINNFSQLVGESENEIYLSEPLPILKGKDVIVNVQFSKPVKIQGIVKTINGKSQFYIRYKSSLMKLIEENMATQEWVKNIPIQKSISEFENNKSYKKDDLVFFNGKVFKAYDDTSDRPGRSGRKFQDSISPTRFIDNEKDVNKVQCRVAQNLSFNEDSSIHGITFNSPEMKFPFEAYVVLYELTLDVFKQIKTKKFEKVLFTENNKEVRLIESWDVLKNRSYMLGLNFTGDLNYKIGLNENLFYFENPGMIIGSKEMNSITTFFEFGSQNSDFIPKIDGNSMSFYDERTQNVACFTPSFSSYSSDWIEISNSKVVDITKGENLEIDFISDCFWNIYDIKKINFEFEVLEDTAKIGDRGGYPYVIFSPNANFVEEDQAVRLKFPDLVLEYYDGGRVSFKLDFKPLTVGSKLIVNKETILLYANGEPHEAEVTIDDQLLKNGYISVKVSGLVSDSSDLAIRFGVGNYLSDCYADFSSQEEADAKNLPLFTDRFGTIQEFFMPRSYKDAVKAGNIVTSIGDGSMVLSDNGKYVKHEWDHNLNLTEKENISVTFNSSGNLNTVVDLLTVSFDPEGDDTSPPKITKIDGINYIDLDNCYISTGNHLGETVPLPKSLVGKEIDVWYTIKWKEGYEGSVKPSLLNLSDGIEIRPSNSVIFKSSSLGLSLKMRVKVKSPVLSFIFMDGTDISNSLSTIDYTIAGEDKIVDLLVDNKLNKELGAGWDRILHLDKNENIDIIYEKSKEISSNFDLSQCKFSVVGDTSMPLVKDINSELFIVYGSANILNGEDMTIGVPMKSELKNKPIEVIFKVVKIDESFIVINEKSLKIGDGSKLIPFTYEMEMTDLEATIRIKTTCSTDILDIIFESGNNFSHSLSTIKYVISEKIVSSEKLFINGLVNSVFLPNPIKNVGPVLLSENMRITAKDLIFVFESKINEVWTEVGRMSS